MIPSVVAHEVARALQDFLATGFGPSNPPANALSSTPPSSFDIPCMAAKTRSRPASSASLPSHCNHAFGTTC